jgi:putative transposase
MPCSIAPDDCYPAAEWLMPDALWEVLHPLLGAEKRANSNGRPRVSYRRTMNALFYVLRTGCQWKALPRSLGSGSTTHAYFQKWCNEGVFEMLWSRCLEEYDVLKGIDWRWLAADGVMTKAPLAARR